MQRETAYDPVFDSQEHYRVLLDAMARPGTINVLPRLQLTTPPGLTKAAALVGFALLNADVSFYAEGRDADTISRYLLVNTGARPVMADAADFVFAAGHAPAGLVAQMKTGSLSYPDEGATIILSVDALAADAQAITGGIPVALTLQGPGIPGERTIFVLGLSLALVEALRQCNQEFPLGVDLILTDPDHRLAGIPRSSRIQVQGPSSI